jgi:hypothetical protein
MTFFYMLRFVSGPQRQTGHYHPRTTLRLSG